MGFSFKKLGKAIGKATKAVAKVTPVGALVTPDNIFRKGMRAADLSAKNSAARAGLRKVDKAVGGAQGWAQVAKAAAVAANAIPVVGQVASAALTATAVGVGMAAKEQAAAKAKREAAAAGAAYRNNVGAVPATAGYSSGFISGGTSAAGATAIRARPETVREWFARLTKKVPT